MVNGSIWLQPIDSVAVNGPHAFVIATTLVSVEVFRIRNTYDVLIATHDRTLIESPRAREMRLVDGRLVELRGSRL